MQYFLAIDIGTSATKTGIVSFDGNVVDTSTKSYKTYYGEFGRIEQDPSEWWTAVCEGIKDCVYKSGIDSKDIVGIGVDGQSWSNVPVSAQGEILGNTAIWTDSSASALCTEYNNKIGQERIFEVGRNLLMPGYQLPKILFNQRHFPEIQEKTKYYLSSNGFIAYKLTGEASLDYSQAYGLHCYDLVKKQFDLDLVKKFDLDLGQIPKVVNSSEIIGSLTKEAASVTGLKVGTPVIAGGLDAACATLGAGVYIDGDAQEQGGQAGGMSLCLDTPVADPKLIFGAHVIPDKYLLQGGTVAGGASLEWFSDLVFHDGQPKDFKWLDSIAEKIPAGSNKLIFLPYLSGERTPIWDTNASGLFFGLHFKHKLPDLTRAVMEGVAFSLKHNIEVASKVGVDTKELYATGGSSNSILWTQIKSDVTGLSIKVPESDAAALKGTAMLIGLALNIYNSVDEAVETMVQVKRTHEPTTDNSEIYQKQFEIYKKLYPHLKQDMELLANI